MPIADERGVWYQIKSPHVGVGPAIEERLNHVELVLATGDPERGHSHFVFGVHIRAGVQGGLDSGDVAVTHRGPESVRELSAAIDGLKPKVAISRARIDRFMTQTLKRQTDHQ